MRNIAKIFFETLRQLTFKKLLKLFALAVSNPIFAVLSFIATVKAYQIAKKYFASHRDQKPTQDPVRLSFLSFFCLYLSSLSLSLEFSL